MLLPAALRSRRACIRLSRFQRVKHSEGGEELNECAYPRTRGLASLVRGGVRQQGVVSCGVAGSRACAPAHVMLHA